MTEKRVRSRQEGMVLVVGLLLLLVMTIIAVGAMSSTHMQERMAGNARTQALALETAAAGASSSLDWFEVQGQQDAFNSLGRCDQRGHEGWYTGVNPRVPVTWPASWEAAPVEIINGVELRRLMYCLADPLPISGTLPNRSQFFVANRGDVVVQGVRVATRTVEVRIDLPAGSPPPGDGCGALCFPGCPSSATMNFPRAAAGGGNAFSVDGEDGAAITAGCPSYAQTIRQAINQRELGAYTGVCPAGTTTCPVAVGAAGSPWDSADEINAFRDSLRDLAMQASGAGCALCYSGATTKYTDTGNTQYGTSTAPQITFFEGNVEMGGSISGAGIMVVNGTLEWKGTPSFQGLLVVLGGTYDTSGGGRGGQPFGGSLVVLNVDKTCVPSASNNSCFGNITTDFTGGGAAEYNFDCEVLWRMRRTLLGADEDPDAVLGPADPRRYWRPECQAPGATFEPPGARIPQIVSWRENLGWRTFLD
jgi:hypothetical protein